MVKIPPKTSPKCASTQWLGPGHHQPGRLRRDREVDSGQFLEAVNPVEDGVPVAEQLFGRGRDVPGRQIVPHRLGEAFAFPAAAALATLYASRAVT